METNNHKEVTAEAQVEIKQNLARNYQQLEKIDQDKKSSF
jgi:hypothetical protein